MDSYMNDTHSRYYNVDHSSMYGSNLSTVFADGPPPLEEDCEDDHGEFVFSPENTAIGEAVLNKIEGKFQKSAESGGEPEWGDFADFNSGERGKESEIMSSNFVAFADFSISKTDHFDTCGGESSPQSKAGTEPKPSSPPEINGLSDNKEHVISESEADESDDCLGDFSSNLVEENHLEDDWQNFSTKPNNAGKKDRLENSFDKSLNRCSNSTSFVNDADFGDFSGLNVDNEPTSEPELTENPEDDNENEEKCEKNPELANSWAENGDGYKLQTESNEKDSEFDDFSDDCSEDGSFGNEDTTNVQRNVQTNGENAIDNHTFDKTKQKDNSCDVESENVASFGAFNSNNSFAKFDDFADFSEEVPVDKKGDSIDKEDESDFASTEVFNADNNFANFQDAGDDFGDFSDEFPINNKGDSNDDKPNTSMSMNEDIGIRMKKVQVEYPSGAETSSSEINIDNFKISGKIEIEGSNTTANADDDFGDFADFSKNSVGSFSQNSGSTTAQNPQTDFGVFSCNSVPGHYASSVQPQYTNQSSISTTNKKVVRGYSSKSTGTFQSLRESFPKTFVALQSQLELLKNLNIDGGIRINQGKLWTSLCNNRKEGILRFHWEQCRTSKTICNVLDVAKEKISVQSSALAMTEGLGVPVFATGLGILQPSVVQTPPKKTKLKKKKSKEYNLPDTMTPAALMPVQHSGLAIIESKTESLKDNNSDTASDTASLDLEFFTSAPSNVSVNIDQASNNSLFNLDFTFGSTQHVSKPSFTNNLNEPVNLTKTNSLAAHGSRKILQKLDTSKTSSTIFQEKETELSTEAKEIIGRFDGLLFMHSSVLMFPLPEND